MERAGSSVRKRILKYTTLLALAIIAAGIALLTSLYVNTLNSRPLLEGAVELDGLGKDVVIRRDANGSPLIQAVDLDDAAFALGFLHGQERFFQMDLSRRKAAGELSALLGNVALESDKTARVHRFRARAKAFVGRMPLEQRSILRRYTSGVNAGLSHLGAAPFEYSLLFTTPSNWEEEDTLLVNMAMYLLLQGGQESHPEIVRQMLIRHYDVEFADFIQASRTEWDDPIVPADADDPAPAATLPHLLGKPSRPVVDSGKPMPENHLRRATLMDNIVGSNSWVVSGRRGMDGRAVLANDMHLPLQQPNTFYRVAIKLGADTSIIAGVTVPGMPMIVAGSNGSIAWGLTNANGDWSDLVRLPKNGVGNELLTVRETIAVRHGSAVDIDVRESAHGPIIAEDADALYAMEWVAHHAEGHTLGLWPLLRIRKIEDALRVAAEAGMPHMNILVADTHGNAAWTIAGRIPRRVGFAGAEPEQWTNSVGWDGWLPATEYPVQTTTSHDFLWTANNRIVGGDGWRKIGIASDFALGVRAKQIHARLSGIDRADVREMHGMQLDDSAPMMRRWHRLATDIVASMADSPEKAELATVLAAWRGRASADSAAYRIVRRFRDEVAEDVMPLVLSDILRNESGLEWYEVAPNWETPLWRILSKQPSGLVPRGHPDWQAYLRQVLSERVYVAYKSKYEGHLARAVWGDANMSEIRHPLSRSLPLIGKWLDMPSAAMNGDSNTILAQSQSFGPAMRLVVTPGHERDGVLTMPSGQAGNPMTPYYGKGHREWQQGKTLPLLPGKTRYVLRLNVAKNRE
jgi:penicillin amidase